jgi:tetratricopeptide (TPR) repeat protein
MKKLLFILALSHIFIGQAKAAPARTYYNAPALAFQQGVVSPVTEAQLNRELENLKERQNIVLEAVSEMFNKAIWIFGLLGSIITLFNFFQIYQDSRVVKLLKEQVNEGKEITSSYQKNISSITSLVGALKEVFEFQASAQRMMEEIRGLKQENEASQKHWDDEITELNRLAMELSLRCKRTSYNDTAFQRSAHEFREEYKNISASTDTGGRLNANCFYILAFEYRILNDYRESLSHFAKAIEVAEAHKQAQADAAALYPLLPEGRSLGGWLTKLQNVCAYHAAIISYNLGRYDEALKGFETALSYDPRDYKSLTYIPEAMYLGHLAPFQKVEAKFHEVIKKIEDLDSREAQGFAETREQLMGQTYMKLGNCYLGGSAYEDYRRQAHIATAEKHFTTAARLDPKSSIVKFSLAQAQFMRQQEKSISTSAGERYRKLFQEVFQNIKGRLYSVTEAKILMMYYYILAICCAYGEIENEIPQLYIMRVHEMRPNLPSDPELRIFSPLTKNDLGVDEFIGEVEQFQGQIAAAQKSQTGNGRRPFARGPERDTRPTW